MHIKPMCLVCNEIEEGTNMTTITLNREMMCMQMCMMIQSRGCCIMRCCMT